MKVAGGGGAIISIWALNTVILPCSKLYLFPTYISRGFWSVKGVRLSIQGTHFTYSGHRVFLAGINKAWEHYAHDFGNGQYNGVKARYEHVFQQLQNAGANSIRKIFNTHHMICFNVSPQVLEIFVFENA